MKKQLLACSLLLGSIFFTQFSYAQYCTPPVTATGIWLGMAGFGPPYGTIPGGTNHNSGAGFASEGYVNRSGASSGTVNRSCNNNYFYSINSCGNVGNKNFNLRIYADWNQDNDFDDANELAAEASNVVPNGNCGFYNTTVSITIPANANAGTIRMRWCLREGGLAATACGGYTGEIEDYSITVAANTAPVINNSGTPLLNPLVETQTSNDGTPVSRFIQTTLPSATLITEADPCVTEKGIAVTGTTGANGTWQYKISSGSWTNMGAVSGSNALLLWQTDRIRFVPSGTGTSTITFRAWDKTVSTNGQYYNIVSTGGTTAFSTAEETGSLVTHSAASAAADVKLYMPSYSGTVYNIGTTSFNTTTGLFKHITSITSDGLNGYGSDIALDEVNNKVYWIGGAAGVDLLRSNTDGTNVETLLSGSTFSWPGGLAIGNNKVFIIDYGVALYSANLDGTGLTAITGGAGQVSDIGDISDIAFYNGKIYYFNQPGYTGGNKLYEADPDGTNTVELLTTANYPYYLDVVNGNLYWTENDGANGLLKTRAISGGAVTTLATEAGRNFFGLMVNPVNSKIYFTDVNLSSVDAYLKSIPLAGGAITRELVLEDQKNALVFSRSMSTLPVQFIAVKAMPRNDKIIVEWKIAEQDNVHHYIVERSADGRSFTDAGIVAAEQKATYQWTDMQPLTGNNFYRIRAVDNDDKKLYSATVQVNMGSNAQSISVYPTVTTNEQFTLRLQNTPASLYSVQVINPAGQQVYAVSITHNGGASVQSVKLPANLAKGLYRVIIKGKETIYTSSILLQ